MEEARAVLADLLGRIDRGAVQGNESGGLLRLEAAAMANRLALFHGDPSLADVAESLAIEVPEPVSEELAARIRAEGAIARAARRAIALAHRNRLESPKDLALSLVADSAVLAGVVRTQIQSGQLGLARATLEVARTRHPDDPVLIELECQLAGPGPDHNQS